MLPHLLETTFPIRKGLRVPASLLYAIQKVLGWQPTSSCRGLFEDMTQSAYVCLCLERGKQSLEDWKEQISRSWTSPSEQKNADIGATQPSPVFCYTPTSPSKTPSDFLHCPVSTGSTLFQWPLSPHILFKQESRVDILNNEINLFSSDPGHFDMCSKGRGCALIRAALRPALIKVPSSPLNICSMCINAH